MVIIFKTTQEWAEKGVARKEVKELINIGFAARNARFADYLRKEIWEGRTLYI